MVRRWLRLRGNNEQSRRKTTGAEGVRVQQMQSFKQFSRPTHHFEPGLFRGRVSHLAGRRPDEMAACAENAGMPVISVCLIFERRRDNYVMILLNQLCYFIWGCLLFCFPTFPALLAFFRFYAFPASLLMCYSAFPVSLLLCLSFFSCFSAFPASLLFCCFAFPFFLFLCFSAFCHFFFFAATASPPLCFSPFLSFLCSASLLMYACCCALPPISPRFLMFWTM